MIEDDEDPRRDTDVQAAALDTAAPPPGIGPPPDLAAIFAQHHGAVLRAAHRITGNAMDAEDVLQTVFTRLLRRPGGAELDGGGVRGLDPSQAVGSYLHRAAVNAALDLLRSRRRSRLVALGDAPGGEGGEGGLQEPIDDRTPSPERRTSSRELGRRLRAAMSRLSPRQAEIFALRYLEGLGNLEIARRLGSSQTAIAVILHRARHRLQQELRSAQGGRS
ncbi:MAG TPA: sigma-70 family RNA polymerase sigma factor [Thermoanaerobaculia bacterium]|jgi:RNA polymerase sigma-70 factor (ECF subfamily)|nr:sigma-70 family RNA polymerase sigma factor [Thermoanaerobaculia bacterium]